MMMLGLVAGGLHTEITYDLEGIVPNLVLWEGTISRPQLLRISSIGINIDVMSVYDIGAHIFCMQPLENR